jgi:hypothetical protein
MFFKRQDYMCAHSLAVDLIGKQLVMLRARSPAGRQSGLRVRGLHPMVFPLRLGAGRTAASRAAVQTNGGAGQHVADVLGACAAAVRPPTRPPPLAGTRQRYSVSQALL